MNDKAKVEHISKPLLSYVYYPAFSFAKCHLEEYVPYDNFSPQLFDGELFTRYARMWTRGYDTYIPTQNIVYHDDGEGLKDVDPKHWGGPRNEVNAERQASMERMAVLLSLSEEENIEVAHANMGIYGLGKRRTLKQLEKFAGLNIKATKGNGQHPEGCVNLKWMPYNISTSPAENMFQDANDLDPQPEYPLRDIGKQLKIETAPSPLQDLLGDNIMALDAPVQEGDVDIVMSSGSTNIPAKVDSALSGQMVFMLWCFGLFVWYLLFSSSDTSPFKRTSRKKGLLGKSRIKDI